MRYGLPASAGPYRCRRQSPRTGRCRQSAPWGGAGRRDSPPWSCRPSLAELESLSKTHLFLMDIGIWLLSDRAVEILMKRSHKESSEELKYYDLYSDFGLALGTHPRIEDEEVNTLSVAILPLPGGEFYHYGTSKELISSTLSVQNKVYDQRRIMHRKVKPNPATSLYSVFLGRNGFRNYDSGTCPGITAYCRRNFPQIRLTCLYSARCLPGKKSAVHASTLSCQK